ncbi:MAG: hypothetical protein ACTHMI_24185 [Mucilaginibacter sp.]
MFSSVSAEDFGLIVLGIVLLYYLAVGIYYRRDIAEGFRTRNRSGTSRDHPKNEPAEVMGPVKPDDTESQLVGAQDLQFAAPALTDKNKVLMLGNLADLMHELKILVGLTIESGDSKENFLTLFQVLLGNHLQLLDGSFNKPVVAYLLGQQLPFELSADEIETILNNPIEE